MKLLTHKHAITVVLTITLSVLSLNVKAQIDADKTTYQFYRSGLGISVGMNNPTGIVGGVFEHQLIGNISMELGAGWSYWGIINSAGFRLYSKFPAGISLKTAYIVAYGKNNVAMDLEVTKNNQVNVVPTKINYYPAAAIMLALNHAWRVGKSSKFYIEGGYAFKLWNEPYKLTGLDNTYTLSQRSVEFIEFRPPGGLVIALGFVYGFGF